MGTQDMIHLGIEVLNRKLRCCGKMEDSCPVVLGMSDKSHKNQGRLNI